MDKAVAPYSSPFASLSVIRPRQGGQDAGFSSVTNDAFLFTRGHNAMSQTARRNRESSS